jgi:predicted transposase YdaD
LGRKEGEDFGIEKGKQEQAKQTARNLKVMGMNNESIAKAVDVEVSVIREWFGENKS